MKMMQRLWVGLTLAAMLLLFGCDDVDHLIDGLIVEEGTLDAVMQCVERNKNKVGVIGTDAIQKQCFRKHEKTSRWRPAICGGRPSIDGDWASFIIEKESGCINTSDALITSISVAIEVENFGSSVGGEKKQLGSKVINLNDIRVNIPPGSAIVFSAQTRSVDDELAEYADENPLPYCSVTSITKPCSTWYWTEFRTIEVNID